MTSNNDSDKKLRVFGYDPGKTHRWGAWLDFHADRPPEWVGTVEVGPGRDDVKTALREAFEGLDPVGLKSRCVVAVETPAGIPFGSTKGEILARGRDMNLTSLAAERFASIAWAEGYRVEQLSAAESRGGRAVEGKLIFGGLCLGKSATDAEVKAALEGNLRKVGRCNVHGRDAVAAALVIGSWILGLQLRHGTELFQATVAEKAKQKEKAKRTKAGAGGGGMKNLPESLRRAMEEQGHGELLKKGIQVL